MDAHQQYVFEAFQKSGAGASHVLIEDESAPSYMVTYGWSANFGLPERVFHVERGVVTAL